MTSFQKSIFVTLVLAAAFCACDVPTSPGTFTELSRVYSPDSSRYLLTYRYEQGAWDGSRTSLTTIMKQGEKLIPGSRPAYLNLEFDDIYWQANDTVIIAEKYTEFISQGKSNLSDTTWNKVAIKVIQRDPIDNSFNRIILYRETSPDKSYELVVYRYVKLENGYYPLHISIVKKGEEIPKYGNFYISRWDFDCFKDIRWKLDNSLNIKVSSSCFNSFNDYLVRKRPAIDYHIQADDTIKGNVQPYVAKK